MIPLSALGYKGKVTCGSEAQYVKDVNCELTAEEIDDTTRASNGWKSTRAGLCNCRVTFDMVKKNGDSAYNTLKTAYKNRTVIEGVSVKDEFNDTVTGDFCVTNLSRNEPLNGVVSVAVTLVSNGEVTFS